MFNMNTRLDNEKINNNYAFFKQKDISLCSLLKARVYRTPVVLTDALENLYASIDTLFSNGDDLTLLIVENCALDILLHRQKIQLIDFSECSGTSCCSGSFCLATRTISIIDFPDIINFSNTIIHEFSHAICGLPFRFDPFPFATQFGDLFPNAVNNFNKYPILPYPATTNILDHNKFPYINPSALKFKQCVREDLIRDNTHISPSSINKLDTFFSDLQRNFPDGILEQNALEEILPIYMECRVKLLHEANTKGFSKKIALSTLASKLPRIHDFFETDLKKVLKHRLISFRHELSSRSVESQFLKQHTQVNNRAVITSIKNDGALYFKKNMHR